MSTTMFYLDASVLIRLGSLPGSFPIIGKAPVDANYLVAESILQARVSGMLQLPVLLVLEEAHNFAPGRSDTAAEQSAVEITRQIAQEGRKFGVGLVLISQRPGRLDETALSMCNSYIIMKMVNPADQNFVRKV